MGGARITAHVGGRRATRAVCNQGQIRVTPFVVAGGLGAPARQQVAQGPSEVATGRDEDEEVAGVVRYRQAADDVLGLAVGEVTFPRRVGKHLRSRAHALYR